MKQNIHMALNDVTFICASCNNKINVKSTSKEKEISIDVCDKCHPFYIGSSVSQQVKGRAEKFSKKLSVVDNSKQKNEQKMPKKSNKKIVHSLNNL